MRSIPTPSHCLKIDSSLDVCTGKFLSLYLLLPSDPLGTPSESPRTPVPSPSTLNFEVVKTRVLLKNMVSLNGGMTIYKVVCVVVCVVRTDGCVRVCVCVCVDGRQS